MEIPHIGLIERQLQIDEVLNRRTDLSTFVVHLTGDHGPGGTAKQRLLSIVAQQQVRAGTEPRGWARTVRHLDRSLVLTGEQGETQRIVSFSETPLEHIYAMFANIANRNVRLRPYGLALTKMVARRAGINPVWYIDMSDGHPRRIRTALNALVTRSCRDGWFDEIKDVFPLIEGMQTKRDDQGNVTFQAEFWWEREWGHIGDLPLFPIWNKIIWLCPEAEIPEIEAHVRAVYDGPAARVHCIDPNWGLERIIGRLAGFGDDDMTPFGPR